LASALAKKRHRKERGMMRRVFGKVMWLGRATSALVGLVVLFALAIGAANSALAHTNIDTKLFHLGHNNPVGRLSALTGTLTGALLKLDNNGTGPALQLEVAENSAPLKVNAAAGTATNLSADELDGKSSEQFANATHPHSGADITSGTVAEARIDALVTRDGEVMSIAKSNDGAGSELDADTLDGKDSSAFVVTGNGKLGSSVKIDACGSGPVLSYPLALTRSGRIFATAFSGYVRSSPGPETPSIRIELLDNSNTVVARSGRFLTSAESGNPMLNISEVLLDVNGTAAYDAPAGNYTLRILAANFGTCAGFGHYESPRLTHIVLAEG